MDSLQSIILLLTTSVVAVSVFRRLTLPPIIAYLVVGMALGPSALGLIPENETTHLLAEFGVVFLLFTIGLEFSFPQLHAMRWAVGVLGGSQVTLCLALFGGIAWWLTGSIEVGVVLGGALALSSTAIVTKQLTEQVEVHTRHGRRAVGVLLFQDLAVVPLLIAIPILAGNSDNSLTTELGLALIKGVVVFGIMVWVGRKALRPIFHEVAQARSNELFTLTVLLIAVAAAWLTHLAGLSLALGAFLAGIMLGETEYRYQIDADIRPFRDVLLGFFFITVGMVINLPVLIMELHWVLLIAAGMVAVKLLLVYTIARQVDGPQDSGRTAIILANGGEFGFALIALAISAGLMTSATSQLVLAAIVLSMLAAPILIRHNQALAQRLLSAPAEGANAADTRTEVSRIAEPLANHVILCGYGRTGQNIGRFLDQEALPYLALDLDPQRVQEARNAGDPVSYGDSERREVLQAAGLERARMIVLSFDNPAGSLKVLEHTRAERPDIPVIVRTRDDRWIERFEAAGATVVVPEILEASLMLSSHVLALLGVPMAKVFRSVREVRGDRYRLLKGYFHGAERVDMEKVGRFQEQLHAITLSGNAPAIGQRLSDIDPDSIGVTINAVRRGGIRGPQPSPDTVLRDGDVLVVYGTPEALEHAEHVLLGGEPAG
ncbi:potassium transporter [Spiribacter aquaticus]|uniref:Potassium transporter n=1 Tax=Spiribacter aquaticus TaxID=1935996 RepID=A0A557RMZ1_9GAMM|nr:MULTISPECIES: monovalent cation:proton antiporter family protein [Spiribacter]KAF0279569.1 potassium transporter [Spiribacter roseus]TVO66531.1 potassium transporter [Spiribacter aquaticus]